MTALRHLSIRHKLVALLMAMSVSSIAITAAALVWYEWSAFDVQARRELASMAQLVGANSTAALTFNDRRSAADSLASLKSEPRIMCARLLDRRGATFATYPARAAGSIPPDVCDGRQAGATDRMSVRLPVVLDEERIGTIYVEADGRDAAGRAQRYALIAIVIGAGVTIFAFFMATPLQALISVPLMRLTQAAEDVLARGDYSVRVETGTADEIGRLTDRFNQMLAQIQTGEAALKEARHALELRVEERTRALRDEVLMHERTERQLLLARDAAEAASRAKSAFLATMSHELRTPLNAIIGYGEMLQEEADELGYQAAVPDLERITGAGRHLLSLISDILDLSKIEAGRMDLVFDRFDAADVIRDVLTTATRLASENRNVVDSTLPAGVTSLLTDRMRFKQILLNLVSNAAKFTTEGRISVSAAVVRTDGVDRLVVTVADTGIGITDAQRARLFQEFSQADASTSRKFGGTGLGLAISQRLSRMMGGDISCSSTPGAGSTFVLTVPCVAPGAATLHADAEGDAPPEAGAARQRGEVTVALAGSGV